MTTPTSPYCTSADVAALVPQLIHAGIDFSTATQPVKVVVDRFITWIAGQINQAFSSVGYYVPFQEISGETWQDSQTAMLELMNSFGAAGLITGPVVKPAPAMGRDSGRSDNFYTAAYKEFLDSIKLNGAGFRANYRAATKAEDFCRTARGPITDHLLGYFDPTRFQTVGEYTNMIETIREVYGVEVQAFPWDHLKTLRNTLLA